MIQYKQSGVALPGASALTGIEDLEPAAATPLALLADPAARRLLATAPTPAFVHAPRIARARLARFRALLPGVDVFYSVKTQPDSPLLAAFAEDGTGFDVASDGELALVRALGVPGERMLFGNPIKTSQSIARARDAGLMLYAADSEEEIAKIAAIHPGAHVQMRLRATPGRAAWPSGPKFGVEPGGVVRLMRRAVEVGLVPAGVSLNVGSQQVDPQTWRAGITTAAEVLGRAEAEGFAPWLLNLGGGFPAPYGLGEDPLADVARVVRDALASAFGDRLGRYRLLAEPGRALSAEAGAVVASVVLATRRDGKRWLMIDAGLYRGLIEAMGETIRYPILVPDRGAPLEPTSIAGMTCDSVDVLYASTPYMLPVDLAEGDRLVFLSAGAYSTTYSAVAFNGLLPPGIHVADALPGPDDGPDPFGDADLPQAEAAQRAAAEPLDHAPA